MITFTPYRIKLELKRKLGYGYQSRIARVVGVTRGMVHSVLVGRRTSKSILRYMAIILNIEDEISVKRMAKWKRQ